MQYVTRWRMQVALGALTEERVTIGELARRLGYRSEAAFARAFKRVVGVAPGAVRRTAEGERAAAWRSRRRERPKQRRRPCGGAAVHGTA
jgi:AraC-like DNA-binding protein